MVVPVEENKNQRKENPMPNTATTFDYKGYRLEGEYGAMSLYSPEGKFLELVDNDEDAWHHIDYIWEAQS